MARNDIEITVVGIEQVEAAFQMLGERSLDALDEALEETAIDVRDDWKLNIEASAGDYAKHYKRSIRYVMDKKRHEARIRPDRRFKQSNMEFEYGGPNQPPHLDGLRALEKNGPRVQRRVDAKLAFLG